MPINQIALEVVRDIIVAQTCVNTLINLTVNLNCLNMNISYHSVLL